MEGMEMNRAIMRTTMPIIRNKSKLDVTDFSIKMAIAIYNSHMDLNYVLLFILRNSAGFIQASFGT